MIWLYLTTRLDIFREMIWEAVEESPQNQYYLTLADYVAQSTFVVMKIAPLPINSHSKAMGRVTGERTARDLLGQGSKPKPYYRPRSPLDPREAQAQARTRAHARFGQ